MITNFIQGFKYFLQGLSLIKQPGLRRYVVIPLLINILVFAGATFFSGYYLDDLMQRYLPEGDAWVILVVFLWIVFGIMMMVAVFFTFTLLANLIGAPFNGPLAAAVEQHLDNVIEESKTGLISDISSAVSNEVRKWLYYLAWAIPLFIVTFIPLTAPAAPVLWVLFGAWMLSLEYMDYPMGNHNYNFKTMRLSLKQNRMLSLGFGCAVMLASMVPVVNLIVMPAAVAGASVLWVKEIKTYQ